MKRKIYITRIIISGIILFSNFVVLTDCVYASSELQTAMSFLRSSVDEMDKKLIREIRVDEELNQVKEKAGVDEFLSKDLVKVESLNIKARPMTKQSAVKASIVNYYKTGNVEPILAGSDLILFPYGLSQPVVACTPLRICHIELEEGEEIIDTSPGDTQRWWFGYTFVGQGEKIKPHVLVKPLVEGAIETNISISTNRRLYYIILKSVVGKPYTKRIGFFYPQDYEGRTRTLDDLKTKVTEYRKKHSYKPKEGVSAEELNFEYVVKGRKGTRFYPKRVFDDGKKVYIEMAKNIQSYELPVFMVIGKDKKYEATNYRYHNPYYIIDRMFDRGVLLLTSTSKKEEKVIIINNKRE